MKQLLLLLALASGLRATCASHIAVPTPVQLEAQTTPISGWTHGTRIHRRRHHGYLGLIPGLLLGPIGLIFIDLVSHDDAVRSKAALGFRIWLALGVMCATFWVCGALGAGLPGDWLVDVMSGIISG